MCCSCMCRSRPYGEQTSCHASRLDCKVKGKRLVWHTQTQSLQGRAENIRNQSNRPREATVYVGVCLCVCVHKFVMSAAICFLCVNCAWSPFGSRGNQSTSLHSFSHTPFVCVCWHSWLAHNHEVYFILAHTHTHLLIQRQLDSRWYFLLHAH